MTVEDIRSRYGLNMARVQDGGRIRPISEGGNGGYIIYGDRDRQHSRREYMLGLVNG